eukprot:892242-Prorocentrum_minimum.AAC.1
MFASSPLAHANPPELRTSELSAGLLFGKGDPQQLLAPSAYRAAGSSKLREQSATTTTRQQLPPWH